MLSEDLQIYKDLTALCKQIMLYLPTVSKTIRYGEYAVMLQKACEALDTVYLANRDIAERGQRIADILRLTVKRKARVYCVNMRKLEIRNL